MSGFGLVAGVIGIFFVVGIVVGVLTVIGLPSIRRYFRARKHVRDQRDRDDDSGPPRWPGHPG